MNSFISVVPAGLTASVTRYSLSFNIFFAISTAGNSMWNPSTIIPQFVVSLLKRNPITPGFLDSNGLIALYKCVAQLKYSFFSIHSS